MKRSLASVVHCPPVVPGKIIKFWSLQVYVAICFVLRVNYMILFPNASLLERKARFHVTFIVAKFAVMTV